MPTWQETRLNPLQEVGVMKLLVGEFLKQGARLNPLQEVGVMKRHGRFHGTVV